MTVAGIDGDGKATAAAGVSLFGTLASLRSRSAPAATRVITF